MALCRCLVVSRDIQDPGACAAQAALCSPPEFECVRLYGADPARRLPDADVVVYCLHDARGCEELRTWTRECPQTPIVVIASDRDRARIGACLEAGAVDFLMPPVQLEELVIRVRRAAGARAAAPAPASVVPRLDMLVGRTPAFVRQLSRLPIMAGCDAGVLITGETGTGKEVFAQAIHYRSARASRPWVAVNCAAIPQELMESELFGHAKGAYTNANVARPGLVREAEGGTLFLDEIDCVPYNAQAKLLRFIQEKEFRPVGSNVVHRVDVRIIAASNADLCALVAQRRFRQDLYYRLNVLPLALPPLRERREDIAALARDFIGRFARQFGRRTEGLSAGAVRRLEAHAWPGNIRELEHVIERAVLMSAKRTLDEADLDLDFEPGDAAADESFRAAKSRVVDAFERTYIERLLMAHDGNVTHAAQAAKKNRRAFFELIRKHKITAERFRPGS
jgi:DNA-binding NtrC family response regulator